jgi:hypothetical protein
MVSAEPQSRLGNHDAWAPSQIALNVSRRTFLPGLRMRGTSRPCLEAPWIDELRQHLALASDKAAVARSCSRASASPVDHSGSRSNSSRIAVALDRELAARRPCGGSPSAILSSVNAILFVMNGWLTAGDPDER